MKRSFFQKQSIGLSALASVRDCALALALVAGSLVLIYGLMRWVLMDTQDIQVVSIGALIGMLPSVLMCLPVYGVVDGTSHDALHSYLKAVKFTRNVEQNNIQFYTQDTPAWARWDSNRIAVKSLPDGRLSIVMPLYCYYRLKKSR